MGWPTPTAAEGTKIGSQANYGQVGLSNHPAIVGLPDREKSHKDGAAVIENYLKICAETQVAA